MSRDTRSPQSSRREKKMPDDGDPEIAIVDDRYWLRRAQEIVSATPGRLDATAAQLTAAIGWFWSVYTAAALVGGGLSARNLSAAKAVVLAIPVILLMAAYCTSLWASVPTALHMDPRVPDEIIQQYQESVATKRKRLMVALALTIVSAISVGISVVSVFSAHKS
jgi:hypothetical protein